MRSQTAVLMGVFGWIGSLQAGEVPFLTKTNTTGYTPAEMARYERCEVYSDRVVITRHFGASFQAAFETTESVRVSTSASVGTTIQSAANDPVVTKPNGLCDGPTTEIKALQRWNSLSFILFSTGACGNPRQERQGPSSSALVEMINHYCPLTYDSPLGNETQR